jgi:hypothetical protein
VSRPGTVLVLYHRPSHWWFKDAATVREHIHSFRRHSRFAVAEANTDLGFPPGLESVYPGAVVLHYSLFGSGHYKLDNRLLRWLQRRPETLKVAFFQDEHQFCPQRFGFVNEAGIELVFTHVSPPHFGAVWGRYAPGVRPVFNLPAYVDDALIAAARRFALPDEQRDLDVGYRGRTLPPYMGAGGQEKRMIGERFRELAAGSSLRLDIEVAEERRLYGDDWYRFLGRCRSTLGVEAGTSFIDLEDECRHEYMRLREQGREPTLAELETGALGRWEGNVPYRTIGPRHFEAAAFRICQVLFEGEYSGVMQPGVHYLSLAKDFSNFDDVVDALKDSGVRRDVTDRAHEDLIASGRYGYAHFVELLDAELIAAGLRAHGDGAAMQRLLRRGSGRRRLGREVRRVTRRLNPGF